MAMIQRRFGARVRALREAREMTQKDLAKKTGLIAQYLSAVEAGNVNVTLTNVERIAKGLGVNPLSLFVFDAKERAMSAASVKKLLDSASPEDLVKMTRLFAIVTAR